MNKNYLNKVLFTVFAFMLLVIVATPSKSLALSSTVSLIPNCTATTGTNSSGISCLSMTMIEFFDVINTKQERMDVQRVLNKVLSPSPNLKVDGVFGKKTTQAVKTFQTQYNLVVDGKIGPITRTALEQAQIAYYGGVSVPPVNPLTPPNITNPVISFLSPTPANGSTVTSSTERILANITDDSNAISSFIDFDKSLVGYWSMDNTSSAGINDNSTYNNFGTFKNGLSTSNLVQGARGQGLKFDGVDDYLSVGNTANSNITGSNITLSAWINIKGCTEANAFIHKYKQYSFAVYNTGSGCGLTYSESSNWSFDNFGKHGSVSPNTWHHVVVTKSQSNVGNVVTIYLDGVDVISKGFGGSIVANTNPLYLGAYFGTNSYFFNGSLDEVMIYNRSLSTTEVKALYDSKVNKFDATIPGLTSGQHNYTVYAVDGLGNKSNSGQRSFVIGTILACPQISQPSPTFCPNGIINAVTDANNCITSYQCSVVPCIPNSATGITCPPSSPICDYAAPPSGCNYIQGPNYNSTTKCGMILNCPPSENISTTDFRAPSITSFTIPTTSYYTVPITSFAASDNVGVTGYKLTETYISPTSTTSGWTATPPTSYTFTSLGTKTLYAWVKDSAGNVSASLSRTVTITNTPNTTCPAGKTGTYPNCNSITTGTTYYISSSGSDGGSGSSSSPWKTLASACSKVTASGSVIHVNAGTYTETSQCQLAAGVSIEGEGASSSIIKSQVSDDYTIVLGSSTQGTNGNQHISGIKMDGNNLTGYGAIAVEKRKNVEIYNSTFIDFSTVGVLFDGNDGMQPSTYPTGNKFYNNTITNSSTYTPNNDPDGEGWGLLKVSGQQDMLIYGNTLNQTDRAPGYNGYLIKAIQGRNKGIKIYDNVMTKNPYDSNTWDFAIEFWNTLGGIEIYNNVITAGIDFSGGSGATKGNYNYSVWIHDNTIGPTSMLSTYALTKAIYFEQSTWDAIVEKNHIRNVGIGVYFPLYSQNQTVSNININSNIFENIGAVDGDYPGWGIYFNIGGGGWTNTVNGFHVYNNVFKGYVGANTPEVAVYIPSLSGGILDVSIRNNIIENFTSQPVYLGSASGFSIENNIFYANGNSNTPIYSGSGTVRNNLTSNPLLTSDFHLQSGSPAINAGINVGLPYSGSAPDIGAYEY